MTVYLAARYSRKEEIKSKSLILKELGIGVTSNWLDEPASNNGLGSGKAAIQDIEDIQKADEFILFSESPTELHVRGGRHFETGYAYGIGKRITIVGPKENTFHFLKDITIFNTWEEFLQSKKG